LSYISFFKLETFLESIFNLFTLLSQATIGLVWAMGRKKKFEPANLAEVKFRMKFKKFAKTFDQSFGKEKFLKRLNFRLNHIIFSFFNKVKTYLYYLEVLF